MWILCQLQCEPREVGHERFDAALSDLDELK
jgi:hypothetical protein